MEIKDIIKGGDASSKAITKFAETIKNKYPEEYKSFLVDLYENINGKHFNEELATKVVDNLEYTDKQGNEKDGAHWSMQDIERATSAMVFSDETNQWDKYVAFNTMYSDLCRKLDDINIINATYLFFFADEDWSEDGCDTKIWDYMRSSNKI